MRRIGLICGVLVAMAIFLIPSMAQSRAKSITDIVDNGIDPALEFTILQELLDSAPRIRNRLDRTGQFTLFAPDDNAFLKMERSTGLTAVDILSDGELLNAILDYHIVDRAWNTDQLRQQNGNFLQTTLNQAVIDISVNPDNSIALNFTTTIIVENIDASNGYIHVVDDVLSNAIMIDIVEDNIAQTTDSESTETPVAETTETSEPETTATTEIETTETSEPETTATTETETTETSEPETTATTETETTETPVAVAQAQPATTANIRVAHFSVDAPDVNFILNDEVVLEASTYGTVSEFVPLPQGIYSATIESADFNRQFEISIDLTVLNGDFVTILVIGSYEDDDLQVVTLQEDFSVPRDDEARLALYNAIPGSPSINLLLDDAIIFESVSYTDLERDEQDEGERDLSIVQTRDGNAVDVDVDVITLDAGVFYLLIIHGTTDEPELTVVDNSLNDVLILQSGQPENTDGNGGSSGDASLDIVDILDERDDFSLLIRAINALDDGSPSDRIAVDILGNASASPVTFLAPNNRAFENLLVTIGYSESRFFADTDLLSEILLYHITFETGALDAETLRASAPDNFVTQLSPLDAFFVRVGSDNSIIINGFVEILETDIQAANGIIHVVDNVLLPQSVLDELGL